MGMPCIPASVATDLMDGTNCIGLQTINVEELSLSQFQTLITVPLSEILVIDETSQLKQVLPSASIVVPDLIAAGATSQQLIGNNSLVVYVPQELAAVVSEEAQLAQQWYEDSVVATQAMDFLSQVLPDTTENVVGDKVTDPCCTTMTDLSSI